MVDRKRGRAGQVIAVVLLVVFCASIVTGIYYIATPPGPYKDQWLGNGRYAATSLEQVRNVTVQGVVIHYTANGCICATNPVTVDVTLSNATWAVDIIDIAFTNSQGVPPIQYGNAIVTGELPAFNSTINNSCPQSDICGKGQIQWQEEGDSWMYFILRNPNVPASGLPQKAAEIGARSVQVDSLAELNGLTSARQAFGFDFLILAATVFGFDIMVWILPKMIRR